MALPRMRTAIKALEEIKKVDPGSEVTLNYIKQLINFKAIPVVACGRKRLVNVDDVLALLAAGCPPVEELANKPGTIRRVI